eukprot:3722419-Prymnesium_polylepis.2
MPQGAGVVRSSRSSGGSSPRSGGRAEWQQVPRVGHGCPVRFDASLGRCPPGLCCQRAGPGCA